MDFVQVEVEVKSQMDDLIQRTKTIPFKGNNKQLFEQARIIWGKVEAYKKAKTWDNMFYCIHLFLSLVLPRSLHWLGKSNPTHAKDSLWVKARLFETESLLEQCVHGLRSAAEERIAKSKSVPPPPYPGPATAAAVSAGGTATGTVTIDGSTVPIRTAQDASSALDALRLNGKPPSQSKLDLSTLYAKVDGPTPSTPIPSAPVPTGTILPPAGLPLHSATGNVVSTTQMRIHKVTGDGHCAFRSIVQGQHRGTLDKSSELEKALALRRCVAKALLDRKDEEMTGTGLTVSQVVLMKDDEYPNFVDYVRGMSTKTYAGETEFWLIAQDIKQPVAIFTQTEQGEIEHMITYGEEVSNKPPICLLWQRGTYSDMGNHYDLLIEE